ncbi:substance-K receptor-like [Stylophora pistillata]|uniref:substance-K receptor-like n=1 Tax=Stylophora pistillata TaxID=50429 RepID=UPI000C0457D2|nr:substance-K receptor-like [Stylophora pistillata]
MSNNATTNSTATSSIYCSDYSTAERVAKTLAYCVIIVVSLTGNILIGSVVFKVNSMRKTINYLIVNMAISDLVLPIFVVPRIIERFYFGYWFIDGPFGSALCKLVYFMTDVSNAVSIQSLVLIAVDRFGAVVFPLRPPIVCSKLRPYFIMSTWIVASALHSPYFFARKLSNSKGQLQCVLKWEEAFGESTSVASYYVTMFLILAVIPFALLSILYSIIILKLRAQKIPGGESVGAKELEKRLKRDRSVLQMVLAIIMGFALCILSCGKQHFAFFAIFMAHANCAINPCICFIFSGNYRQGLKSLFGCCSR